MVLHWCTLWYSLNSAKGLNFFLSKILTLSSSFPCGIFHTSSLISLVSLQRNTIRVLSTPEFEWFMQDLTFWGFHEYFWFPLYPRFCLILFISVMSCITSLYSHHIKFLFSYFPGDFCTCFDCDFSLSS